MTLSRLTSRLCFSVLALGLLSLSPSASLASEHKPASKPKAASGHGAPSVHGAASKDQGPVDVELPPILAPMTIKGRLDGYAYITIALAPADRGNILAIREKLPFLQDAFLRELNRGSILKADDPQNVDTAAIKPRLLARMNKILPAGTVAELKFVEIVIVPANPNS